MYGLTSKECLFARVISREGYFQGEKWKERKGKGEERSR